MAGDIANRAVDPCKIVPRLIEHDHVDVVVDLFGLGDGEAGKPLYVLVPGLAVLFEVGGANSALV
jgi:hypothetical protein